ncbi:MAG: metal-sensing transcriptional repressor [Stenotrophobium sp.]
MTHKEKSKTEILARLRRVEGQVRALQAMIAREEACESVAQQMAAARKALDKTFYQMLGCAMEQAVHEDGPAGAGRISDLLVKYG